MTPSPVTRGAASSPHPSSTASSSSRSGPGAPFASRPASTAAVAATLRGPTPSQADNAHQVLCDRLVTLQIAPGEALSDARLAAELGTGRTPVREALKRLESERLVVTYPRRGTFASEVHLTDLAQLSEVRLVLEPLAAACAADRATDADIDLLGVLLGRLQDSTGLPAGELYTLDMTVHRAIYAATHNSYLAATATGYDNLATRIWCLYGTRIPGLAGHIIEHEPLVQAVIAGDARTAQELARAHVASFQAAVRTLV